MARYDAPTFLISEAAQRAGMHAQTLRTYDRLGLVVPRRTAGRGRRYSLRDIDKLSEIQRLSQEEGINLAGIAHIFALAEENEALRIRVQQLRGVADSGHRIFTASPGGDIVAGPAGARPPRSSSGAVVVWRARG